MTTKNVLSDLHLKMELAHDQMSQATDTYKRAEGEFNRFQELVSAIQPIGKIEVINSEGTHSSLTVITQCYKLDERRVLFAVTELPEFDDHPSSYVGHIFDYVDKTILFACQFYFNNFGAKENLFDRLISNYIEWRMDL